MEKRVTTTHTYSCQASDIRVHVNCMQLTDVAQQQFNSDDALVDENLEFSNWNAIEVMEMLYVFQCIYLSIEWRIKWEGKKEK